MSEKPLNNIKNKAMNYASAMLLKVELAAEQSKLKKRYQSLGQKLHGAIWDDLLAAIKDDPSVVELLGAIEEQRRLIDSLKARIEKYGECDCEEA